MSDSAMPNLPGFGAIAESMELVRKMWGGTATPGIGFPGMTTPSMSAQEIDKQIADLKAVEAWLTLNMNMLRGTIQALEVQSATISALKSMGEAFKNAGRVTAAASQPAAGFSFPFASFAQPQEPQSPVAQSSQQAGVTQPVSPDIGASLADPATWWNMLQGQFTQAVTAAAAQRGAGGSGSGSGNAAASASANDSVGPSAEATGRKTGAGATGQEAGTQRRAEPKVAAPTAPAAETTPQSISPPKRTVKAAGKPPSP